MQPNCDDTMDNGNIKKAAFLVRCSTNKQDYERQVRDLKLVADRFGYEVYDIYGEHITGKDDTTTRDRLSIIRVRKDAELRKFDLILVSEVSRMSRDSVSGRVYIRQFCNLNIPVYFRDKMKWTIDPNTMKVDESFIREVGSYFDGAADYLKSMKTQIASWRRNSLMNNQLVIGHPPIGYKKRGGNDKFTKNELVIDENLAPMVKDVFSMYLEEGGTLKSVALAISTKYSKELKGKRKSVSGIYQILCRTEYYTGQYTVYMSDPDNKDLDPEPFTLTFEPLIDQETFEAAAEKRNNKKSTDNPYPKQVVHPLTRLIKCPHCEHSFSPRVRSGDKQGEKYRIINGKKSYSWLCMTRINNSGQCKSHVNLNNEKVETIIWDFIKKELLSFADLNKDDREIRIYDLQQKIADAQNQIPLYEQEIAREDNMIKRAYTAYMNAPDSAMDDALKMYNKSLTDSNRRKDEYAQEIKQIKKKIKGWEKSIAYYNQSNITAEYIDSIEEKEDEKRKIFIQLIQKIEPIGISPGTVVLKTSTINGIYWILFDGNQVGERRVAHYIHESFAVWHRMIPGELQEYESKSYFSLKNHDIILGTEEIDVEHVSFRELEQVCEANDNILPYNYIYERAYGR